MFQLVNSKSANIEISVNAVAFNPVGQSVLSGGGDGTLILWDVSSGAVVQDFVGHQTTVTAVAFSPDGQSILSGTWDGTLTLWDVSSGAVVQDFVGHQTVAFSPIVKAVAFSPDGQSVLSGDSNGTLILWDVSSGAVLQTFIGHESSGVKAVAFNPDGQSVLSGACIRPGGRYGYGLCDLGELILWDIASGEPLRTFTGHRRDVITVVFSSDGKSILSGAETNTAILWRIDSPEDLIAWTCTNRYIRALNENDKRRYDLEIVQDVCEQTDD